MCASPHSAQLLVAMRWRDVVVVQQLANDQNAEIKKNNNLEMVFQSSMTSPTMHGK